MKRTILLSIILLIGLSFIRAPSYAETRLLTEEQSTLSPLSSEARRFLEYEKIERMRDSLEAATTSGSTGGDDGGLGDSEGSLPVPPDGVPPLSDPRDDADAGTAGKVDNDDLVVSFDEGDEVQQEEPEPEPEPKPAPEPEKTPPPPTKLLSGSQK